MIVFTRNRKFPKCKHCGKRMEYYVLGLPDEDHAHVECSAKYLADQSIERLKKELANNG